MNKGNESSIIAAHFIIFGMIAPNCIIFVDSWTDAAQACIDIKHYSVIGLDIELLSGNNKNDDVKTTSLIQIAISHHKTYIFDVLTLGQALFDACYLLPILVNPQIIKLCYDCRGDAEALFINHGVRTFGLYDLQIVFTSLFQAPMDPFLKGLKRAVRAVLSPEDAYAFGETKARMKRYFVAETAALNTLHPPTKLMKNKRIPDEGGNINDTKKNNTHNLHSGGGGIMSVRPLYTQTLRYCAEDAIILLQMYSAWSSYVDTNEVFCATLKRANGHIFHCTKPLDEKKKPKAGMHYIDFRILVRR